jgi:hypothetical protein
VSCAATSGDAWAVSCSMSIVTPRRDQRTAVPCSAPVCGGRDLVSLRQPPPGPPDGSGPSEAAGVEE